MYIAMLFFFFLYCSCTWILSPLRAAFFVAYSSLPMPSIFTFLVSARTLHFAFLTAFPLPPYISFHLFIAFLFARRFLRTLFCFAATTCFLRFFLHLFLILFLACFATFCFLPGGAPPLAGALPTKSNVPSRARARRCYLS